jgi:hypothetical protein
MGRTVQIVYSVPQTRDHEVYEFTCPYCDRVSEIKSLLGFRCECGRGWDEIEWTQPLIDDDRHALRCEDPTCSCNK